MEIRPTLAAPDDDPYLWLEEIDGAEAVAWVERQNAVTLRRYGDAGFARDRDALRVLLDSPDNLPYVRRRGAFLYNYWKDATNPRGLWRRTTLDSYRTDTPQWDVLLDLDALATAEDEDWIWHGADTIPGTHDRAILHLSRGGGDAAVLREFDLTTRTFVAAGFNLPEGKSGISWLDRDTLLLWTPLGDGHATASGYARTVRLWKRGEQPLAAPVIFEGKAESMSVAAGVDRDTTGQPWFVERLGFFDIELFIGDRTGPKTKIDLPSDATSEWHRGWLAVKPRAPWTVGGQTYAPDTLLGIAFADFLSGKRDFVRLFEPQERRALDGFFWCGGRLVLSILDNLRPVGEVLTPAATGPWKREAIEGLPPIGTASIGTMDAELSETNGDLLATVQSPVLPPSLTLLQPGSVTAILKRGPAKFDPSGIVVTQHEVASVDGVNIPYVQIGPPRETGEAPVHLYGYGGFQVSVLPSYGASVGKLWLERGGTHVIANIRGGGEFGTQWHEAARRERRHLAHDDFAAVAADLVKRGVTRPGRIAAEGGSNGGILITNMLTRYPERFGALFCTIPLIDMRRYTKLLAGASWIAEYGDPDKPEEWDFLAPISAYHMAQPGKPYPPILIATSRRDDRVHPGHARKMAAKLQAMGYDASFYEPAAGGHGYGKDNAEVATFTALGYRFMRKAIGWDV